MYSLINFVRTKTELLVRNVSNGPILSDKVPAAPPPPPSTGESVNPLTAKHIHKPSNMEKRFLIWSGKYKTIEEIPTFVSYETLERARSKARIRIANYMMLATAIACVAMAVSGKRAAERGESVQKMNLDWHKEIKEKYVRDQEALAAAKATK